MCSWGFFKPGSGSLLPCQLVDFLELPPQERVWRKTAAATSLLEMSLACGSGLWSRLEPEIPDWIPTQHHDGWPLVAHICRLHLLSPFVLDGLATGLKGFPFLRVASCTSRAHRNLVYCPVRDLATLPPSPAPCFRTGRRQPGEPRSAFRPCGWGLLNLSFVVLFVGCHIAPSPTSYCARSSGDKGLPEAFLSTPSLWGKRGRIAATGRISFFSFLLLPFFLLKTNPQKKKKSLKRLLPISPPPSVSPTTPPTVPPSGQIWIRPFIRSPPAFFWETGMSQGRKWTIKH